MQLSRETEISIDGKKEEKKKETANLFVSRILFLLRLEFGKNKNIHIRDIKKKIFPFFQKFLKSLTNRDELVIGSYRGKIDSHLEKKIGGKIVIALRAD